MGIPGLQKFIDEFFTEWRREAVRGNLVVDGNQLCYQLYRSYFKWQWEGDLEWVYGGQYPEYRAAVEKFFRYLQQAGVIPIVVFDGLLHMKEKFKTVYQRYKHKAAHRHTALLQMPGSPPRERGVWTLPPLAYQVFHATLQVLGVQQIIADGEGDVMVIRMANELNCPVLSKDSDFFMAHLPKGYIPLDRFKKGPLENPTIEAEVFHLSEFYRQFGLQAGNDLHLAIPAVMGNDSLKKMRTLIERDSTENRFKSLIDYLKQFPSFEAFLADTAEKHAQSNDTQEKQAEVDDTHNHPNSESEDKQEEKSTSTAMHEQTDSADTKEKPGNGEDTSEEEESGDDTQAGGKYLYIRPKLRRNYERAVETYKKCTSKERVADKIPRWLAEKYYRGEFNSLYLLGASLLGFQLPASSETSKLLRQYAYSILGVGFNRAEFVHEYPATSGMVNEVRVEAVHSIQGSPSQRLPRISEVEGLTVRKQLLYQMLACDQDKIETLEEKWRLVIASVVFWAKETQPNQALVKALLVCFLLCYKPSTERLRLHNLRADSWLETQSAFIAWQCTYLDSIGLNQLLMEPLQSPSAAFLFDGKLVMGLAAEPNVDDRVKEFGIDHGLYQSLLSAVLPQYEALAAWKSVNRELKPKARPGSHSRRSGREPHRAGPEPHSHRVGPELHSRRAGPEPHSRRAGPEPHSRRAGPEPHSRRTGREPQTARGKIQSKPGKQKQKSESQTKTTNRFGLLPDDCDD